jgi:aromatic ring-opening dioxygenase catalytic subunit (LigB family)
LPICTFRRTGCGTMLHCMRMPVLFIPHGGGPWPFVDLGLPARDVESLAAYLRQLPADMPAPNALLVISAHWEANVPTVMTSAHPPILYDYYGFPPESYEIQWPAPGDPALATRVREHLARAGIETATDPQRGFDHGTFIPLKLAFPEANIPAIQLSLRADLDPQAHLAIGRALAPLRDNGVLIVGSGMSFHNLRAFFGRDPQALAQADAFDAWLGSAITADPTTRDRQLAVWSSAPGARAAHPREEHLLPLMVIAGAAGADRGVVTHSAPFMGARISGYRFSERCDH